MSHSLNLGPSESDGLGQDWAKKPDQNNISSAGTACGRWSPVSYLLW